MPLEFLVISEEFSNLMPHECPTTGISLCFLKIHIEAVFRSDNLLSQQIHIHPKDAKILEHDVTEHHKRLFRVRVVFLFFKQGCH